MTSWAWEEGTWQRRDALPVTDRGFRYGMSVFESMRVRRGQPVHWYAHVWRLYAACEARAFPVPNAALGGLVQTLREHGGDGFARAYITAGDGAVDAPVTECRAFLMLEERPRPAADAAYRVEIAEEPHRPLFSGLKTANYWAHADFLQRARAHGNDEALLFNESAELISACMANVFLVRDGITHTPALPCGARDGVLREWVLGQIPVVQDSLFMEDVLQAEEVFITNSWLGVMPVRAVGERKLPAGKVAAGLRERLVAAGL